MTSPGRLVAVVGPSGVGKDSVMSGLVAADPSMVLVRRTITRPPDQGGERYDAATSDEFDLAVERGAFCLHWGAHDLRYGIPAQTLTDVESGATCLANLSRNVLHDAAQIFPLLIVLRLTARPETLARRLAERGRESADDIARRLARADTMLPDGLMVFDISNDGPLSETVAQALHRLQPVRA